MKDITLERLVDLVIEKARNTPFGMKEYDDPLHGLKRERTEARSSLLERINKIQQEADEWRNLAESLIMDNRNVYISEHLVTKYRALALRYPHVEEKGTGVKG